MFGFPSHRGMFGDPWSSNAYQQRAPTQWDAQPSWFMDQDPWQQWPRSCYATQADLEQQLLKQRLVRQQQAREQQAREQLAREQLARQQHAAAARMRQVPEPLVPPQSHQQQVPAPMHKQQQQQAAPFPERSSSSCSSHDSFYSTSSAADSADTSDDEDCYSEPMECCSSPPQPANKQQQRQQQQQAAGAGPGSSPKLSPSAAAVVIQAAWRMSRLARHRPALKQLAAAAAKLRAVSVQLEAARQEAAAAGAGLTQKQYLELSEPVMKVLFALDAISCGPAVELRMVRKRLSNAANALLDRIQAVYNAPPLPAATPQLPHQQPTSVAAAAAQPAAAQQRTKCHKSRKLRRLSFD